MKTNDFFAVLAIMYPFIVLFKLYTYQNQYCSSILYYHQLCKYIRILSDWSNYTATVNNKLNKFHMVHDNRIINASFSGPSSKFVKVLTRHLTEYMPVYTDIVQGMPLDCWQRHCPSPMPKRYSYFYLLVNILLFCSFLAAKKNEQFDECSVSLILTKCMW